MKDFRRIVLFALVIGPCRFSPNRVWCSTL